ncbi:ribose-phosphate pyrophosphokinase [Candidatus Roizmanbacteria bacterium]|nr:ribose-phosphate pyrophosphokinase [Candidatus Roizmanbacteria bacterium]
MLKLFSGSAHPKLSDEVAKLLKISLSKAEVVRFGNSEVRVTIQEDVRDKTCVLIQPTVNPTDAHLMELLLFCDALRRQEAKYVVGYIPYFGYARQDIQHRPGECVSANVVIRFLEAIGFSKIYTIEIHDEATQGVFSIPFKNLTALPILAQKVKYYLNKSNIKNDEVAIVSPDQGGVERARSFGNALFGTYDFTLTVIEKKRNLDHMHRSKTIDLYGYVSDKTAILVDDMVVSGSTLVPATKLCLENGAKKVLAAVVHHDFSVAAPKLIQNSEIKKFFTTNTIALKTEQHFPKLEEISVAALIADEIKKYL